MSRLFVVVFGALIFLTPISLLADEKADQKMVVITLYESYMDSLGAGDYDMALKFSKQMYELTPKVYGKISNPHATAAFNLAQMSEL